MKNFCISFLCFAFAITGVNAQEVKEEEEEEVKTGFKKENLFVGGTVALGFANGQTAFGIGPYFGYSINKYIDVALSLNYNYVSQRDNIVLGDKLRQSIIGPGVFTRIYPVKFLFAHAQYEQNFIKVKYIPASNSAAQPFQDTESVGSVLVGPGFASGRGDSKSFYYISVLFDVAKNKMSPYVDSEGRMNPIIRAGFNFALFQGGGDRGAGGSSRRNRF